jgi:hypothetical protein
VRARSGSGSSPRLNERRAARVRSALLLVSGSLTIRPQSWHPIGRRRPSGAAPCRRPKAHIGADHMKVPTVDEERIEREHEQAADKLAEEVAEIAHKFTAEAAKITRKRPPLKLPSVRTGGPVRRSW